MCRVGAWVSCGERAGSGNLANSREVEMLSVRAESDGTGAGRSIRLQIDPGKRHQIIENFGASDAWSTQYVGRDWSVEKREEVARLLFCRERGIGLSLWRFNVGAGSDLTDLETTRDPWRRAECFRRTEQEDYDWSRQEGQQWFLRAARDRGVERFVAFVNSPPVWATLNGKGHSEPDCKASTNLRPGYEGRFASFLVDLLEQFGEERGIPFTHVSPVNEPSHPWTGGQEGCRYANEDIRRVVRALAEELESRGMETEIVMPEAGDILTLLDDEYITRLVQLIHEKLDTGELSPAHLSDLPESGGLGGLFEERGRGLYACNAGNNRLGFGKYREYIKDSLGDRDFGRLVGDRIAAHSYGADHSTGPLDRLDLPRRVARQNLDDYGASYWMSEYCIMTSGHGRDLGISPALFMARVIHHDLTVLDATAWQWWLAVSPYDYKDGLIYTDWRRTGEENVLPSKMLWALGNYSRFVRPGARRIGLEGAHDSEGLMGSAYLHEEERRLVLVLVNMSSAAQDITVWFRSPPRSFRVDTLVPHTTSEEHDLDRGDPVRFDAPYAVPPRSVVTLVGKWQETG